jgi:hypothetical protein
MLGTATGMDRQTDYYELLQVTTGNQLLNFKYN